MQGGVLRGPVADDRWVSGNGDATFSGPPDSWEDCEGTDDQGWNAESCVKISDKFQDVSLHDPRDGEAADHQRQSHWSLHDSEDVRYGGEAQSHSGPEYSGQDRYEDGLPVSDRSPGSDADDYHPDEFDEHPGNRPRDDSAYVDREINGGDDFDGFFHPHERENQGDERSQEEEDMPRNVEKSESPKFEKIHPKKQRKGSGGCVGGLIKLFAKLCKTKEEEWWEMWSARDNDFYYHNKRTDEVVWDPPERDVIIRYGTGPDGGAPYYSPFDSKGIQESIAEPLDLTVPPAGESMDEFLTLPSLPTLKKSNTLDTDVSFGTGVPSLQFSFDGKNERDLEAFLEYFDSDRCLNKTGSFAGAETPKGAGRLSPTAQQFRSNNRSPSPSGSPRRVSPPSATKVESPSSLPPCGPRDRRSSPPLSPGSDTRSSPRSPNRFSGSPRPSSTRNQAPPSSIFQTTNQNSPRVVKDGRMPPPPSTNMWGAVSDSSNVPHSSPFAAFSSFSLVNRDSASLTLDENIISEIVKTLPSSRLSSAIQGLPSLEVNPPTAPLSGVPSLSGGLALKSVSTDIDSVFGRSKRSVNGESSNPHSNGKAQIG
ncbi:hypothetical protein BSKO_08909 [Bryopsis sp. KO-2023]|nr:hypothetical protein BSKO_08909 [Bryopsis sp. KO-2023]